MRRGQARFLFFVFLFNLWTNLITPVLCSRTCVVGFLSHWFGLVLLNWHVGWCTVLI